MLRPSGSEKGRLAVEAAPHDGNSAFGFFTNHETRVTDFIAVLFAAGAPGRRKKSQHKNRRPVIAALFTIVRHCSVFFWGRRPEPLSAHRPHQQHGLLGFHETRVTNHGLYVPSVRRGCAVRRKSGVEGGRTQNRNPPPGPPRPPQHNDFPAHVDGTIPGYSGFLPTDNDFSSHYFPAFPAILRIPPGAGVRAPSGLLPLRRTSKEPTLRKEKNVLYCVDSALHAFAGPPSRSLS